MSPRQRRAIIRMAIFDVVWCGFVCSTITSSTLTNGDYRRSVQPVTYPAAAVLGTQYTASIGTDTPTASTTQTTETAKPMATAVSIPTVAPTCTIASYQTPTSIDLYHASTGVTVLVDRPTYYEMSHIYTASVAHQALANCATRQPTLGGYHAVTAYTLNWTYYSIPTDDQLCRLADVKVTVHISQLLPHFAHDADTSTSDQVAIDTIADRLAQHENQHVSIDTDQAHILYANLTALQQSCGTIIQSANSIAAQSVDTLTDRNQTLDKDTAHGTQ